MTSDVPDQMGRVSLHYAAVEGSAEDVEALLASGAEVAAQDRQGFTALHFACQQNRPDVAMLLLEAGAPVDLQDRWGNTPLWRAVFNARGQSRIVRTMVSAGADPDQQNFSGISPRQLASTIGNYDTSGYFADD